ncbi:MAG: HDIG domain-containing protein [Candidatus Latescibacteria bacterium]|nr:HDIG domain-containing protein [Candidatus Latescibacterota bacterium]
MTRQEAFDLVTSMVSNKNLIKHMLACEACMKRLAKHFGENEEEWGLVGLLHDLDYDSTCNSPEKHTLIAEDILREKGISEEHIKAIKGHCDQAERDTRLAKALYCIDPITGLIVAATLMHPEKKLSKIDKEFVLRRYKEKGFAKGANREQIAKCADIELSLEDFTQMCIEAMTSIAQDLGF